MGLFDDIENTSKIEMLIFDSYSEHIEELMKITDVVDRSESSRGQSWIPGSAKQELFVGREFTSWKHFEKAANSVWPDGLKNVEDLLRQLEKERLPPPHNIRRLRTFNEDTGDEVCLDRLRRGQPYWRTTHREHRPGPLSVTIICNVAASKMVTAKDILWRGAATICLTELLERSGHRVEVWAGCYARSGMANGYGLVQATCVKRATDPIDRSTLVNATSGWSFRTLNFGSFCIAGKPANNLGYPLAFTPKIIKQITNDDKVITCNDVWSNEEALTWVKDMLETIDKGAKA